MFRKVIVRPGKCRAAWMMLAWLCLAGPAWPRHRSLWVWSQTQAIVTDPNYFFNFCASRDVKRAYIYMPPSWLNSNLAAVRSFVQTAHTKPMQVFAMWGDFYSLNECNGPAQLYTDIDSLAAYNLNATTISQNAAFDGLAEDIEFHDGQAPCTTQFSNDINDSGLSAPQRTARWALLTNYLDILTQMKARWLPTGKPLQGAIVSWTDNYYGQSVSVTYNSVTQPVYRHAMGILNITSVMSYNTTPATVISVVSAEAAYAASTGRMLEIGQETDEIVGSAAVSWGNTGLPESSFNTALRSIIQAYQTNCAVIGLAIHDFYYNPARRGYDKYVAYVDPQADTDGDGDGMLNHWEISNGLDMASAADGPLDPDGDGRSNLQEFQMNSEPHCPDAGATATGTPTPTRSSTATPTCTATPSPTRTATPTPSRTTTPSASASATPSQTATGTSSATRSRTATASATPSPSATATASSTVTPTFSPSLSRTATTTRSATATPSSSASPSRTATTTASPSATLSTSSTPSRTPSASASASVTRTFTSSSDTPSASATVSVSFTGTVTPSQSPSSTPTPSFSPSATASGTPSPTPSASATASASSTGTVTPSQSPSSTPSPSSSATPSLTLSNSSTTTPTPSASSILSPSASLTETASASASPTPSSSPPGTGTASSTATSTPTPSPSASATASASSTATASPSLTLTHTAISTASSSPTPSAMSTATASATPPPAPPPATAPPSQGDPSGPFVLEHRGGQLGGGRSPRVWAKLGRGAEFLELRFYTPAFVCVGVARSSGLRPGWQALAVPPLPGTGGIFHYSLLEPGGRALKGSLYWRP